ncbi:16 kDa phloem protein 1 isoform X1 [Arachis duranensis]|uniref:16 kDa phloem protein 1 isoform X1 n=1 Tax=Arachis duranensis TaxID=130453 RepID=A0A6P4AVG3_ARADU|nr:16 kDa phloem protein 1 isoform X1 [Arachis duranensis]
MAIGFMEVQLLKANDLKVTDFLGKIDPYVVIQYKRQEQRSSVANGQGRNPTWNEKFMFRAEYPTGSGDQYKLILKIMDKDTFSKDDSLGQAIIYVKDLLAQGIENGGAKLQALKYRVIDENNSYCGEVDVAITFTPKVKEKCIGEDIGGWKESCY